MMNIRRNSRLLEDNGAIYLRDDDEGMSIRLTDGFCSKFASAGGRYPNSYKNEGENIISIEGAATGNPVWYRIGNGSEEYVTPKCNFNRPNDKIHILEARVGRNRCVYRIGSCWTASDLIVNPEHIQCIVRAPYGASAIYYREINVILLSGKDHNPSTNKFVYQYSYCCPGNYGNTEVNSFLGVYNGYIACDDGFIDPKTNTKTSTILVQKFGLYDLYLAIESNKVCFALQKKVDYIETKPITDQIIDANIINVLMETDKNTIICINWNEKEYKKIKQIRTDSDGIHISF